MLIESYPYALQVYTDGSVTYREGRLYILTNISWGF